MNFPEELKYTKDHEWVRVEGDVVTVGITDFAQKELGDIVYVEVDTLDEELSKEEVFGTVEAVKTVSDLFIPVSGEVIEFNDLLEDEPEKVNTWSAKRPSLTCSKKRDMPPQSPVSGNLARRRMRPSTSALSNRCSGNTREQGVCLSRKAQARGLRR